MGRGVQALVPATPARGSGPSHSSLSLPLRGRGLKQLAAHLGIGDIGRLSSVALSSAPGQLSVYQLYLIFVRLWS
jgi:hypothetical protein